MGARSADFTLKPRKAKLRDACSGTIKTLVGGETRRVVSHHGRHHRMFAHAVKVLA